MLSVLYFFLSRHRQGPWTIRSPTAPVPLGWSLPYHFTLEGVKDRQNVPFLIFAELVPVHSFHDIVDNIEKLLLREVHGLMGTKHAFS